MEEMTSRLKELSKRAGEEIWGCKDEFKRILGLFVLAFIFGILVTLTPSAILKLPHRVLAPSCYHQHPALILFPRPTKPVSAGGLRTQEAQDLIARRDLEDVLYSGL